MHTVPITSIYAALLGLVLVALSARVMQLRLVREISLGDGGYEDLQVAQRSQGNFVEYVPIALLLVGLVELGGTAAWVVHALGGTLLASRLLHPLGLATEFSLRPSRAISAFATLLVIVVACVLLLVAG